MVSASPKKDAALGSLTSQMPAASAPVANLALNGQHLPRPEDPAALQHFLTARDSADRLTPKETIALVPRTLGDHASIFVDPAKCFQEIEGIGGAFTESAAYALSKLGPANRKRAMQAYFDRATGHGYTLCRTHMNSCDFSLSNYANASVAGDFALDHFTIQREKRYLLPMLKEAHAWGNEPYKLFVSPWSPPAWMKTNDNMNMGGKLRPECRDAWARCFVKFIQAYQAEGIDIWAVTVQNEPAAAQKWDSCVYTPEEERDFVRDHLGPALERAGLGHVKIIVWDHNRDRMVEWADTIYSDPRAARYVWGTGIHWYGDDNFENSALHHDLWPDKPILFTEGCQEGGPHLGDWAVGERYARSMIADFNRWVAGWVDWNLFLDATGGPNHVGNYCSAPIIADAANDRLLFQSSYFYIGHLARFVRPGARRILCSSTNDWLEAAAFLNRDGTVAIVVLNRTDSAQSYTVNTPLGSGLVTVPSHSISTYCYFAE